MTVTNRSPVPLAFMSYSHDNEEHRDWVWRLSDRLVRNGVDVTLDRWGLRYSDDIARFMEQGVTGAQWFIAVCTPRYVQKADNGEGGAGYEKTILTPSLMKSTNEKRVIPVWRGNPDRLLPIFIGGRLAVDFNNDEIYEENYASLLRTLHGREIVPRPPLGPNPFEGEGTVVPAFNPARYACPNLTGDVTFDYSNNDGNFDIGSGELCFTTRWSSANNKSIHCYKWGNISSLSLASGIKNITEICDATKYDTSSRARTPTIGEFVILRNQYGYYAAIKISKITYKGENCSHYSVTFKYWILSDRSSDFSCIRLD